LNARLAGRRRAPGPASGGGHLHEIGINGFGRPGSANPGGYLAGEKPSGPARSLVGPTSNDPPRPLRNLRSSPPQDGGSGLRLSPSAEPSTRFMAVGSQPPCIQPASPGDPAGPPDRGRRIRRNRWFFKRGIRSQPPWPWEGRLCGARTVVAEVAAGQLRLAAALEPTFSSFGPATGDRCLSGAWPNCRRGSPERVFGINHRPLRPPRRPPLGNRPMAACSPNERCPPAPTCPGSHLAAERCS